MLPRDADVHLTVAWATGALMSYVADFYRRCACPGSVHGGTRSRRIRCCALRPSLPQTWVSQRHPGCLALCPDEAFKNAMMWPAQGLVKFPCLG